MTSNNFISDISLAFFFPYFFSKSFSCSLISFLAFSSILRFFSCLLLIISLTLRWMKTIAHLSFCWYLNKKHVDCRQGYRYVDSSNDLEITSWCGILCILPEISQLQTGCACICEPALGIWAWLASAGIPFLWGDRTSWLGNFSNTFGWWWLLSFASKTVFCNTNLQKVRIQSKMIYQNNIQTFNMLLYNKYFLCQRFIPLLFKKKLLFIFQEDLCVS